MISVIAGALLFTACAYTGISVRRVYKIRFETMAAFVVLAEYLKAEIAYLKTPLNEILSAFCLKKTGLAYELVNRYNENLPSGCGSAEDAFALLKNAYLTVDETKLVSEFLFSLGKNDINGELGNIEVFRSRFCAAAQSAEKIFGTNGGMYYKLAVLLGVALMIIVV